MSKKTTALIVLSGGQDSTSCLFGALDNGYDVHAITFDYGQRHAIELEAAKRVFELAARNHSEQVFSHEFVEVGNILTSTSPLVSAKHTLEQYKDKDSLPGGIEKTFVPMRNQLFLTLAANRAVALGATVIVTGVCQEDSGGYPDCRQSFITALAAAINESNGEAAPKLRIATPLMYQTKAQSVRWALELSDNGFNAYGALAYSHTSYDGQYPPLGKDHATLLREKGFFEADIPDPLILRAVHEGLMPLPNTANYRASPMMDKCQDYVAKAMGL